MSLLRPLNPDDPVLTDGSDRALFRQIEQSEHLYLYVLEDAGAIVGTVYLNVVPNLTRSLARYAIIENVVVDSRRRGEAWVSG